MTLTSQATVATDAAARYAKQLASHLGRKCEVVEEDAGTRLVLTAGDCLLTPTDDALELAASAPDEEALDRVEDVVGRHLERFGARNELTVTWRRATAGA